MYFLATLIFISALRKGNLNVLYPITSVSYIWVSLLSIKFLKENSGSSLDISLASKILKEKLQK